MRFGIDLGGSKIEIVALNDGCEVLRERIPTPQAAYHDTIRAIRDLVLASQRKLDARGTVGVAIPGTISAVTGFVKNANSTWLIGLPLDKDLAAALDRPVRVANDANCFALSEASDGAAAGADIVFGVILGTGCGGGVTIGKRVLSGTHGIAGEWGHNPLPGVTDTELAASPPCYCGRTNCIETWISGPAVARHFRRRTGRSLRAEDIAAAAASGDGEATAEMDAFLDRTARGLASIVNVLDPDVIVLGGGLSNIDALYTELPRRVAAYSFTPEAPIRVVRNRHGDSSGVRGAAWLWSEAKAAALGR